jgi:mono/diheme cytochrome c family protein
MLQRTVLVALLVLSGNCAAVDAQPQLEPSRGELLYTTHCIACHDLQVHWRDKKLVRNWRSLRAEVYRWQKTASLRWSDADIAAVTQYLNIRYYHYPEP